jgi:hypothetical protein
MSPWLESVCLGAGWWSRSDSNRRPPACKAGALPTELRPRIVIGVASDKEELTCLLKFTLCDQLEPGSFSLPSTMGGNEFRPLLRKEVIQPQVPLRLPCYDFVPITSLTLGHHLPLLVGKRTSGETGFHDVTGGVYKARERIHGAVADAPLLAIPAS